MKADKDTKKILFSDLSPFKKALYGMWRKPSYTKEEVVEFNKDFLRENDERIKKRRKQSEAAKEA